MLIKCLILNNLVQAQLNTIPFIMFTPCLALQLHIIGLTGLVANCKCRKSRTFKKANVKIMHFQIKNVENHALFTISYYRYYRKNHLLSLSLSLSVKKSLSVIPGIRGVQALHFNPVTKMAVTLLYMRFPVSPSLLSFSELRTVIIILLTSVLTISL